MATEQALAALVAYDYFNNGKGSIYQFTVKRNKDKYTDEEQISAWA